MQKRVLFGVLCSFLFALPDFSFAGNIQSLLKELENTHEKYEVTGTVCEQAARVMLAQYYPEPNYEILTGIEYSDYIGHVLGELDVVVFDHNTQKAILVAEVKCCHNAKKASRLARRQLRRFKSTLSSKARIDYHLTNKREIHFQEDQFDESVKLISISPKGGDQSGFDVALDYSIDELMYLQKKLMKRKTRSRN